MASLSSAATSILGRLANLTSLLSSSRFLSKPLPALPSNDVVEPPVAIPSLPDARAEKLAQLSALGPWNFMTSRYMFMLLGLALLMYRIPNIMVPPRPAFGRRPRLSRYRRLWNRFLPLDLSRTSTRLVMHLPTIFLLFKTLLLWCIIILQTANIYPRAASGPVHAIGKWCQSKTMVEVNWATFSSICAAFCVETFVKGLDGVGFAFGGNMEVNTSPFNLVGYAFLLHVYSNPITHVNKPENLPTRPDKHAAITIAIPVLQLTMLHLLSVRKRWSTHRLIPTAISSFLSLLHFHLTLLSHANHLPEIIRLLLPSTTVNATESGRPVYSSPTGAVSYPLLNYIPNVLETMLVTSIILTVALNSLAQLLLTGQVTRPLFGLGLSRSDGAASGSWSWSPSFDEDFGVLLLRVGVASLEATGLRGWANESAPVIAPASPSSLTHGSVVLDRSGVVRLDSGSRQQAKQRAIRKGLSNEVRNIRVRADAAQQQRTFGIPGFFTIDLRWFMVAKEYLMACWSVMVGGLRFCWECLKGNAFRKEQQRLISSAPVSECTSDSGPYSDELAYERFLRGEHVSDDDDDDWEDREDTIEDSNAEETEEEDTDPDDEKYGETIHLYSDLVADRCSTPDRVSSTTLLAHMTNEDGSPLTRRRFSMILDGNNSDIGHQSLPQAPPRPIDENRRNCVVCTVEARQIICWPCRCLTMCDECRENMASMYPASKHRCPCCRKSVEGYSRIYIP